MTATAERHVDERASQRRRNPLLHAAGDTATIVKRNLLHVVRTPQLIVFSTIQPVMFVLLFTFVFGGAIQVPGGDYADYLIPGILVQTALFGAGQTAVGLAQDLSRGIVDRFRSLPMARSAVLAGRTVADACRNFFVVLLTLGVGYLVGFRFNAGFLPALGMILLAVAFGFTYSWMMACLGLATRNPEAAQAASFVPTFPLVFASSVFVRVQTMPDWLQPFARNQPISVIADTLRALNTPGAPIAGSLLRSAAWITVLLAVAAPLAVRLYRKRV